MYRGRQVWTQSDLKSSKIPAAAQYEALLCAPACTSRSDDTVTHCTKSHGFFKSRHINRRFFNLQPVNRSFQAMYRACQCLLLTGGVRSLTKTTKYCRHRRDGHADWPSPSSSLGHLSAPIHIGRFYAKQLTGKAQNIAMAYRSVSAAAIRLHHHHGVCRPGTGRRHCPRYRQAQYSARPCRLPQKAPSHRPSRRHRGRFQSAWYSRSRASRAVQTALGF